MTKYTDSMPICSIGGMYYSISSMLAHVCKGTVAMDNLGNTIGICDLMPENLGDVVIWDQCGA